MNKIHKLTVNEAQALLQSGRCFVVDTNPEQRWLMHHVPGAFNLDPADFSADDLPRDKTMPLLFYCKDETCVAGEFAAKRAVMMGFQQVYTLPAGINGWISTGMSVERCYLPHAEEASVAVA